MRERDFAPSHLELIPPPALAACPSMIRRAAPGCLIPAPESDYSLLHFRGEYDPLSASLQSGGDVLSRLAPMYTSSTDTGAGICVGIND